MGNKELAGTLLRWNLLEKANRSNTKMAWSYLRWSLTTSFLELMNALQWFASGIILRRSSYLPSQTMQSYYYSIFFSYGSFLAMHGKGHYTLSIEPDGSDDIRKIRRELWFDPGPPPMIAKKKMGRGGEHRNRANWFYEVFKAWDQRDSYPAVRMFEEDRKFHTVFRNMFTYSLFEIAEELHHDDTHDPISDDILLGLWNQDNELPDYFPEEFWALAHLKPPFDTHCRLIDEFSNGDPLTHVQEYMLKALISRHEETGLAKFLTEVMRPMLSLV